MAPRKSTIGHVAAATLSLGTVVVLVGCQEGSAPDLLPVVTRDSADIRIVENASPAEGSRLGWRIGPEPAVSIGAVEGEEPYLLHRVLSAFRLPNGRIVAANGGTREVRIFTATGTHVLSWGREGQGPGEFGWLGKVAPWSGDSIVAWYSGSRGISFFDASGTYGRSVVLPGNVDEPWIYPRPVAVRGDGTILSVTGGEVGSMVVEIRDGDGVLHASLGTYLNSELITVRGPGGPAETVPAAYSRELVTTTWGDLVVVTWTKPYEIRAFRADGTLARIVRREHEQVAPTEADRQVFLDEQMAVYRGGVNASSGLSPPESMLEELIRPLLESITLAEHLPAFSTVLADDAGHLWVREYDPPQEESPVPLWTVFDPEGRVLGFVETPVGLEIQQIGEDFILARVEDELGVEHLQVWPLER